LLPIIKILVKTAIYSRNLNFSVDNLCNCVEKVGDKPVLSLPLGKGLVKGKGIKRK
jgi:hypothetical protein